MDDLKWILSKLRTETGREDLTRIEKRQGPMAIHYELTAGHKHYIVAVTIPFVSYTDEDYDVSAVEKLKAVLESEES